MAVAPATPQGFTLQQGNGQVLVSWQAVPGVGVLNTQLLYNIQRCTDNFTWAQVQVVTNPYWLDTTTSPNTLYYYRIQCSNGSAVSQFTNALSITPTITGQMTLGQLRLAAQQRADLVNSPFVSLPEWNSYINQSYFELYGLLVQKYGDEYFVAPPIQFGTTGAQFYPLPDGIRTFTNTPGGSLVVAPPFFKLLGLDLSLNSTNNAWLTLKRFNFIARNNYLYPQLTSTALGINKVDYRIMGNSIQLIPVPSANQMLQMWYVPRMTTLLQDTDICDGVSGWTEYIIVDAALKALQKQDKDVSVLAMHKADLVARIEAEAENRDAGEPDTISDMRRDANAWGFGGPMGGY